MSMQIKPGIKSSLGLFGHSLQTEVAAATDAQVHLYHTSYLSATTIRLAQP